MQTEFDVAIVGGGPSGAAAAITLARAGRSVLLIEKEARLAFKVGEGLPPAAVLLLRELGVMERFDSDGHLVSYGNASAWGSEALQSTDFIRNPYGHGWHLDRPRFDATLRDAARESGAQVAEGTRLTAAVRSEHRAWQLTTSPGRGSGDVEAQWMIDCTGRASWLARRQGAKRRHDDRLVGFVATFRPSGDGPGRDTDSITRVEAAPDGWWYTTLLPTTRRVVVYLSDADNATALSARTSDGYLDLLARTRHIRDHLAAYGYDLDGSPRATLSNSARLDRVSGDGWLAAGDAAAAYDPLSSQGIFAAMYSGLQAGRALDALLHGDPHSLEQYQRKLDAIYQAYLRSHGAYYRYEQRWPTREFWVRRQGVLRQR